MLVEGGGILTGSLFDQRLVDRVFAFIGPIIIGGQDGGAVVGVGANKLSDATAWSASARLASAKIRSSAATSSTNRANRRVVKICSPELWQKSGR